MGNPLYRGDMIADTPQQVEPEWMSDWARCKDLLCVVIYSLYAVWLCVIIISIPVRSISHYCYSLFLFSIL
jgi:hypothetical protein